MSLDEFSYEDNPRLYDKALEATDLDWVLEEYEERGYSDPLELLEPDQKKQVVEVVEAQAILNGETGSLAGLEEMDYLHTGRASD
mgnify:FL=1